MSFLKALFGKSSGLRGGIADLLTGADASLYKQRNLDNYTSAVKSGGDLTDVERAHINYWSEQSGGVMTTEGLQGIKQNVDAGLEPGMGLNAAGMTHGNFFTNPFNPGDKGFVGDGSAMLMGGSLGGLAAYATGGEAEQGALIGGVMGVGIRNVGKGFMKGLMGDLSTETKYIDDLLGGKPIQDLVKVEGKTLQELQTAGLGSRTLGELDPKIKPEFENLSTSHPLGKPDTWKIDDIVDGSNATRTINEVREEAYSLKPALWDKPVLEDFGTITGTVTNPTRKQSLDAIAGMGDTLGNRGMMQKYKRDVLMGEKHPSVGQKTRMAGLVGSALSGMAFSSSKRDHRRGFNKKRGNRV